MWKGRVWEQAVVLQKRIQGEEEEVAEGVEVQSGVVAAALKEPRRS